MSGTGLARCRVMDPRRVGILLAVAATVMLGMTTARSGQGIARYHVEPGVPGSSAVTQRFTATQIALLEKINRADADHLHRLSELVVPESWLLDERAYTNLTATYSAARAIPKLLVVSVAGQSFGAYELGVLVRWGPVSTGAQRSQTPAGWFHLNWRSTAHVSTVDPDWYMPWYFNFRNAQGLAFHQYALPGRPASHGCVRLLARDAKWLFEWGEPWTLDRAGHVIGDGTPVLITGAYDFDTAAPWSSLAWLATPIELPTIVLPAARQSSQR